MKSEVNINGNRLQITRFFDAPRALVFGWWTKPEKLQQWSGCKEALKCEVQMNFRAGGSFTQKMQIAVNDGTCEFSFSGKYDEIVVPERIVYHAAFGPVATKVTVQFRERGTGTQLVLTHEGCPNEMFSTNISQGTAESFDKLESLLNARAMAASL